MGLLDRIMSSTDGGGNFAYLQGTRDGTRNVCRVIRMQLDDPTTNDKVTKPAFKVDVEVLASTHPSFGTAAFAKGSVARVNPPSKFVDSLLACARRFILAASTSKMGEDLDAALGLKQNDGESDKAFALRVGDEYGKLVGPQQPLAGSIITIISTVKGDPNQKGYTLYEALVPTTEDLKLLAA